MTARLELSSAAAESEPVARKEQSDQDCSSVLEAEASVGAQVAPALDDERKRRSKPLLLDETGSLRRATRPAAHCSLGRNGAARCLAGRASASRGGCRRKVRGASERPPLGVGPVSTGGGWTAGAAARRPSAGRELVAVKLEQVVGRGQQPPFGSDG